MKSIYIQRKRSKGFNLQAQSPDGREVVSCTRPSKFGNPITVSVDEDNGTIEVFCNGRHVFADWLDVDDTQIGLVVKFYQKLIEKVDTFTEADKERSTLPVWHNTATIRHHLTGKHLACWCAPGAPCHVQDVLLPIINGEEPRDYNV